MIDLDENDLVQKRWVWVEDRYIWVKHKTNIILISLFHYTLIICGFLKKLGIILAKTSYFAVIFWN